MKVLLMAPSDSLYRVFTLTAKAFMELLKDESLLDNSL